jgi:outer membrane scaffolding protein for murein synthesis (MipA/OmpV family)
MQRLRKIHQWRFILAVFILLGIGSAYADTSYSDKEDDYLPLWELGGMALGARLPHYIGSDEYEDYLYLLPYVIYRGDILRADREGIRGIFYKGEKFETSLSFWGNPPVSDDNEARQGMPDLDAIGEVGPALRYYFYRRGWLDRLYLQAAWRAAISFDFESCVDTGYEGWHGSLDLSYQNKSLFKDQKLSFYLKGGVHFADSLYNNYFYSVADQFATPHRSAYEADGGYSGFSLSGSIYKELSQKFSIGFYARWNNIDGAVFEDSPLVRENNNYAVGFMLVWKLAKSKKPAP